MLVRFGARDYSADIGRWIARDPIRLESGDENWFSFVEGDPINRIDPLGLFCSPVDALESVQDFARNYQDMREANTIGGDKYFHCKANCQAHRRGCGGLAEAISDTREWLDENLKGDPADACRADQEANEWGRQGAGDRGFTDGDDCRSTCNYYRPRGLPGSY